MPGMIEISPRDGDIKKSRFDGDTILMKKINIILLFSLATIIFLRCNGDDNNITGSDGSVNIGPLSAGDPARNLEEFEVILEALRGELRIPGYSAAIAKNGQVLWAKGFGYANVEDRIKATPTTAYHLASLTKTFASTIIMKLVEEGDLDLESPVSDFGIELDNPDIIQVKHLFTHTSEGVPGSSFRYNGGRFALLDDVILGASGKSFCELLEEQIINLLGLERTVPNLLAFNVTMLTWPERVEFAEYLAQGYTSDGTEREAYPTYFGTAAGLISSVLDMAEYSIAIDENRFLKEETKALVFSPTISIHGEELPYGLGWFVQDLEGVRLAWHYGWWTTNSSLIIKVPERELTFVILANTDMLSRAFPGIGNGDIRVSVVALEFLNAFVFGDAILP